MEANAKFPSRLRLKRKREFDAVFAEGRSAADGNLVVHVLHTGLGYPRLGLAVGRRHGNAVRRNRIKRLIREAFRLNRESLPESADMVIVVRESVSCSLEEISASLVKLAGQAGGGGK